MKKSQKTKNTFVMNGLILIVTIVVVFFFLEAFFRIVEYNKLQFIYTKDTLWELKPNSKGIANGEYASINSFGLRGDEILLGKKSVVILGDSFTFGYGLKDNETIPHLLHGLDSSIEVINAGVPGYGIRQMIALYQKKISQLQPDIVVLMFIEGDIVRQKLPGNNIFRHSALFRFIKPRIDAIFIKKDDLSIGFDNDKEIILNFNSELNMKGIRLILFPYVYKEEQKMFYDEVKQFSEQNNLTILENNFPLLEKYPSEKLFLPDGHPNSRQAELIADFLNKNLEKI